VQLQDLLALAGGVAARRNVDSTATYPAGAPTRCRSAGLELRLAGRRVGLGKRMGKPTGSNLTDRSELSAKGHLIVDGQSTPVSLTLSGASRNDSCMVVASTMP
jgi:hypothetical protein